MKYCVVLVAGLLALVLQTSAQCLSGIAPVVASPAVAPGVVQVGSVANTLADTLSLLTVSSLLAEKLPLGYSCGIPAAIPAAVPAVVGGCGCGYPYGGYPYGSVLI